MKRKVVGVLAAALLLGAAPAQAAVASAAPWPVDPTCNATSVVPQGTRMTVMVHLEAVPPPDFAYEARCYVYVGGRLIGIVEGQHVGVVIVGAGVFQNVPLGPVSLCVEWEGNSC